MGLLNSICKGRTNMNVNRIVSLIAAMLLLAGAFTGCSGKEPEQPLPGYFSLADEGRVSESKRQNSTMLCWDYAATAAAESAILSAGLADSVDLSEGHLFYYFYPYEAERPADSTEDGIYVMGKREDGASAPLYLGGDVHMAFSLFANGAGPANEKDVPFDSDSEQIDASVAALMEKERLGEMTKYQSDWLLTDYFIYYGKPLETLKRAVYEKGAMCIGIKADAGKVCRMSGRNSYYSGAPAEGYASDHLIVLIGWDDAYSRENFGAIKPENDGAWIAMDSSTLLTDEDGILYISYEENFGGGFSAAMCRRDEYTDVLHYDLCASDYIKESKGDTVAASVFSAQNDCVLRSVGLLTACDGQKMSVEVYVDPQKDLPQSGKRAASFSAAPEIMGYHVCTLPEPVALSAGDTFSVVVSYKCGEDELCGAAPFEGTMEQYSNLFAKAYVTSRAGESYVLHDGVWYDTSKPETAEIFGKSGCLNNAAIKALLGRAE